MKFWSYIKENFLSSRDLNALPERVLVTIKEREQANEVLARIIQLMIVIMFSILYSLATKTGNQASFQPVPYVLTAYITLSLIGLYWSMRSPLPDWAVYCSILFDFVLLYSLMTSFHIQYEQPASFILKAPTLLYVFIFISLRALRLEWKFVAAAGITGALGWILVVMYVINSEPQNTMITNSYVQYLTSNSILIGAEIDKIISILAVTGILIITVNGSSNLLVTSITEQVAAQDFSRFFDARIAQDIRSSDQLLKAGEGNRRSTAVINIDIRGFSVIAADLEPSEAMQILSAYQGRVVPILQQKSAIIDKFMGDGIMATVGIDDPDMPFSRLAVEAAEAILEDANKWEEQEPLLAKAGPIRIGIGIACGMVSFGAVGQGDRLEMTVIGSPVNTSAKLEKHNKTLNSSCIISEKTWKNALKEGYSGNLAPEFIETEIEGIEGQKKIAVLRN